MTEKVYDVSWARFDFHRLKIMCKAGAKLRS